MLILLLVHLAAALVATIVALLVLQGPLRTFLASRAASGALDPGTRRLLFGALAAVGVTSGAFLGAARQDLEELAGRHHVPRLSTFAAAQPDVWFDPGLGATTLRSLSELVAFGEGPPKRRALLLGELADLIARLEAAAQQGAPFRFLDAPI